ncbi:MAG: DNA alkylation repair protein [Kofleriaceae bacterium]
MAVKAAKSPTAKAKSVAWTLKTALAALEKAGTKKHADSMQRFGIGPVTTFGVPMAAIQKLGKTIGKDHALATQLWASGVYDARMLAAYVAEAAKVTSAEMDAWCAAFDNWAVCDTLCFALWDRVPFAWDKIEAWASREEEFVKRAAFALLASVALHDKGDIDAKLAKAIGACERAAGDKRNFVKKGVSWALRTIGSRSGALRDKAIESGKKLAKSSDATERWIGNDVVRDLERPLVAKRVAAKDAKRAKRVTKVRPSSSPCTR